MYSVSVSGNTETSAMELVLQTSMKIMEIKERKLALGNEAYSPNIGGAQVEPNYNILSDVGEET